MKLVKMFTVSIAILFSISHSFGAGKYKLANKSDIANRLLRLGQNLAKCVVPFRMVSIRLEMR